MNPTASFWGSGAHCRGGQPTPLLTTCQSICLKQAGVVGLDPFKSVRPNIQSLSYAQEAGLDFRVKSSSRRSRAVTEWGA